jgi:Raf kinase inhibitor-like YbhB/YbcL family protein
MPVDASHDGVAGLAVSSGEPGDATFVRPGGDRRNMPRLVCILLPGMHCPRPECDMRRLPLMIAAALATATLAPVHAQQGDGTDVTVPAVVFKPRQVEPTRERLRSLEVADGLAVTKFAEGLGNARILAVAPAGHVYVTRREEGDVLMLHDADGDGRADGAPKTVARRAGAHGLAIHDGQLYLATVREVFVAPIRPDGTLGELRAIIDDLPDGGQHPNRTLAVGPDDMLYISIGSSCNACNETNPEHATMLRASLDGKTRTIFASGLRNTIGFDWHPQTGELWGFDHGTDFLGNDVQEEELNRIGKGRQYGWPHVYCKDGIHPQTTPQGGISKEQWREMSEPMVIGYTAHAAPMQMVFYPASGSLPERYRGGAFVTMRGSWNREPASGYELVHVAFDEGRPARIDSVVSGFLTDGGRALFARLVGLAVARDGALLMSDDAHGVIYRVAASGDGAGRGRDDDGGGARAATNAPMTNDRPPAEAMRRQAMQGVGVPLAMARAETATGDGRPSDAATDAMQVRSPTIGEGAPIPKQHSEYAEGHSPALSWNAVEDARSYVLVMEDPDAKPITPFVHWVAYNIPADATQLPEGLPKQGRLKMPEGMLQGANSYGSIGYYGPKPPVGDPPHRYHFQVFAIDRVLDLKPHASRDEVLAAIEGHVIGKGELTGTFALPVEPPK